MKKLEAIEQQIANNARMLADCREAASANALDLMDRPDDPVLLAEQSNLSSRVTQLETRDRDLKAARDLAARRDTKEVDSELRKQALERADEARAATQGMIKPAKKLQDAIDKAGAALAEIASLQQAAVTAAADAIKSGVKDGKLAKRMIYGVVQRARFDSGAAAFVGAMYRAGFGRVALHNDMVSNALMFQGRAVEVSISEMAELNASQLSDSLTRALTIAE